VMGRRTGRERSRGWRRRVVRPTSTRVLTAVTSLRGNVLGERANDIPNSVRDLPGRMGLCVGRSSRRNIDMSLDVGSRTADFLHSTVELITMRSPVGTVSNVLHDAPQSAGELRVLCEHGADHSEECGDIASEIRGGLSGRRVELCKGRICGIVDGRGGRWDLLDIDSTIGGEWVIIARNFVDVNGRFLRGVVCEDGIGGRCRLGLESLAPIYQRRCGSPGAWGGSVPDRAGAKAGAAAHLCKLDLVPRSGAYLATVEGIESRNPLPIILDGILVERDSTKRVVGWSLTEPVRNRRSVREWFLFEAADDTEVHNIETSKWWVRIGSVVIFEFLLGAESNFVTVDVGIGHSDAFDGDIVQRVELRRYFDPRGELSKCDTTGYTVFAELELGRRGHG